MPANFHYNLSLMAGVDVHNLIEGVLPCVVACPFNWPGKGRTTTVTADGELMIQEGFSNYAIVHAAPVKSQVGIAALAITIAKSGSKPIVSVASVQADGKSLVSSIMGSWGLNLNCGTPCKLPTGITLSFCTVSTSPTVADFAWSLAAAAVSSGASYAQTDRLKVPINQATTDDLDRALLSATATLFIKWAVKPAVDELVSQVEALVQKVLDR